MYHLGQNEVLREFDNVSELHSLVETAGYRFTRAIRIWKFDMRLWVRSCALISRPFGEQTAWTTFHPRTCGGGVCGEMGPRTTK